MKRKSKFIALVLCIATVLGGISSAYAIEEQKDTGSKEIRNTSGYLTEGEVFAALAYTFDDVELSNATNNKKVYSPNGVPIKNFTAEDYSNFTDNSYGGMYLDKNGNLVLCYTEGSDMLKKVDASAKNSSNQLLNESKEVLSHNVVLKSVEYSYADLLSTYEELSSIVDQYIGFSALWVSNEDNRVVLEILPGPEGEKTKEQLSSMFDQNMLLFLEADPDDRYKAISSINGTSQISTPDGDYVSSSTPAGRMWSSSKGYYGIITCGHGHKVKDTVYKGRTFKADW